MGILHEYAENEGTGSCSAQKNFFASNCGLPSTSAAGLEVEEVDLLTYLAA